MCGPGVSMEEENTARNPECLKSSLLKSLDTSGLSRPYIEGIFISLSMLMKTDPAGSSERLSIAQPVISTSPFSKSMTIGVVCVVLFIILMFIDSMRA